MSESPTPSQPTVVEVSEGVANITHGEVNHDNAAGEGNTGNDGAVVTAVDGAPGQESSYRATTRVIGRKVLERIMNPGPIFESLTKGTCGQWPHPSFFHTTCIQIHISALFSPSRCLWNPRPICAMTTSTKPDSYVVPDLALSVNFPDLKVVNVSAGLRRGGRGGHAESVAQGPPNKPNDSEVIQTSEAGEGCGGNDQEKASASTDLEQDREKMTAERKARAAKRKATEEEGKGPTGVVESEI
ncbi:hypothetical protein DFH09DRAFT_1081139 [Mycena vulgaris]|nr:hypothetical protein DFH09DRAFT_1081139 [Mycena vulgaris]